MYYVIMFFNKPLQTNHHTREITDFTVPPRRRQISGLNTPKLTALFYAFYEVLKGPTVTLVRHMNRQVHYIH